MGAVASQWLLRVRGVGPLCDAVVEVPARGVTLLVGGNGSGKSLLARAFFMAAELLEELLQEAVAEGSQRVEVEAKGLIESYFGVTFSAGGLSLELSGYGYKLSVRAEDDVVVVEAVYPRELVEGLREERSGEEGDEDESEDLVGAGGEILEELAYGSAVFIPAARIVLPLLLLHADKAGMGMLMLIHQYDPLLARYIATVALSLNEALARGVKGLQDLLGLELRLAPGGEGQPPLLVVGGRLVDLWHLPTSFTQLLGLLALLHDPNVGVVVVEDVDLNLDNSMVLRLARLLWSEKDKTIVATTANSLLAEELAKLSQQQPLRRLRLYRVEEGRVSPEVIP